MNYSNYLKTANMGVFENALKKFETLKSGRKEEDREMQEKMRNYLLECEKLFGAEAADELSAMVKKEVEEMIADIKASSPLARGREGLGGSREDVGYLNDADYKVIANRMFNSLFVSWYENWFKEQKTKEQEEIRKRRAA